MFVTALRFLLMILFLCPVAVVDVAPGFATRSHFFRDARSTDINNFLITFLHKSVKTDHLCNTVFHIKKLRCNHL